GDENRRTPRLQSTPQPIHQFPYSEPGKRDLLAQRAAELSDNPIVRALKPTIHIASIYSAAVVSRFLLQSIQDESRDDSLPCPSLPIGKNVGYAFLRQGRGQDGAEASDLLLSMRQAYGHVVVS